MARRAWVHLVGVVLAVLRVAVDCCVVIGGEIFRVDELVEASKIGDGRRLDRKAVPSLVNVWELQRTQLSA